MKNNFLMLIMISVAILYAFSSEGMQVSISDRTFNEVIPYLVQGEGKESDIRNPHLSFEQDKFFFECDSKPLFIDYHVETEGTATIMTGALDINVHDMKANGSSIGGLGKVVLMTVSDILNEQLQKMNSPVRSCVKDPLIDDDYQGTQSDDITGVFRLESFIVGLPVLPLTQIEFTKGYVHISDRKEIETATGDIQLTVGQEVLNQGAKLVESLLDSGTKLRTEFSQSGAVTTLDLESGEQVRIEMRASCPEPFRMRFELVSIKPEQLYSEEFMLMIVKIANEKIRQAARKKNPATRFEFNNRTLDVILDISDFVKTPEGLNCAVCGLKAYAGYFSIAAMLTDQKAP